MSFETGSSLKLEKNPWLFPWSQSRSFTGFLDKVTMKGVWTEDHQQSEAASHRRGVERLSVTASRRRSTSPHGKKKDMDRRNRRLPSGEELIKRSWAFMPYLSKTAFFFKPAEVQRRTNFLNGVFCGLSDRSGGKEAERTTAKRQRWAHERSTETKRQSGAEPPGLAGAKRQSGAERECPSNAGLDS